ncbi:signal peptide peptidase-domain-containing protein [Lasiosphaeria hispida]|uniref:Signal peptide peptidase-domain-containing protein n=1 Tax=Lasiosphaeria hispida TaxID=260671 RepID=A0AAJ0HUR6_9PEZI|nr:signal peptide peptidase-domain-containing protein [Lasiosphaeria hispida]
MPSENTNSSPMDEVTSSTNSTNSTPNALPHKFTYEMLLHPDFLLVEAQVILSALSIIWIGAHASLRRPPSAAVTNVKKGKKQPKDDQFAEGFTASDAIMLPIMAGAVLIGLYYLIEWLQDPDLLNKILRIYLSAMSIASLGRLSGDALEILTSLVFPIMWADRQGVVHHIDPESRSQFVLDPDTGVEQTVAEMRTPFPGFLSTASLSKTVTQTAWEVRHILTEEWTLKFAVHGLIFLKFDLTLNNLVGFPIAILITMVYHLTGWHVLSNLLGSAFSYSAFSLMSPTSFGIGSSVLVGLFVYDIIMVFYTPYMITVAKKVDAPIKLVFRSSGGVSMLGLGDIIIPGLLLALALRFDMYRFYQTKIKLEPIELASEVASETPGETTKTTTTQYRRVKAPYVDPRGQWGIRFWTTKFGSLRPVPAATSASAATAFPKPYFYAAIFGYAGGMILTLTVLIISNHGQPALLYLVPCVTGSVWVTALLRGELKELWAYTEDGSLDTEDVVVQLDANGNVVKETAPSTQKDAEKLKAGEKEGGADGCEAVAQKGGRVESENYDVFLFSITAPRHRAPKQD